MALQTVQNAPLREMYQLKLIKKHILTTKLKKKQTRKSVLLTLDLDVYVWVNNFKFIFNADCSYSKLKYISDTDSHILLNSDWEHWWTD